MSLDLVQVREQMEHFTSLLITVQQEIMRRLDLLIMSIELLVLEILTLLKVSILKLAYPIQFRSQN